MIGPAESQPPQIAKKHNIFFISERLSKRSVKLRSQKWYAAKPTLNPAEPTPECAKRRSISARVTAKPTLASARYR